MQKEKHTTQNLAGSPGFPCAMKLMVPTGIATSVTPNFNWVVLPSAGNAITPRKEEKKDKDL